MNFNKNIGILGGIGPTASANMYSRIIRTCQSRFKAVQDVEFPYIAIVNYPVINFNEQGLLEDATSNQKLFEELVTAIKALQAAGADFIVPACNTIHYLHKDLQAAASIPVINLVEETVVALTTIPYKRIAVLASRSSRAVQLYEDTLDKQSYTYIDVTEDEQKILDRLIRTVMTGRNDSKSVDEMRAIIKHLYQRGAEAVIIGCTELSVIAESLEKDISIVDSLDIAVKVALDRALGDSI